MGYSVHRFVSHVDPNLICGICANVLEDSVITPCGHSFCKNCLETWLENSETDTCPTCRTTTLVFDLIPVLSLRGLVSNLHTSCDHVESGCKMVVKLENLAKHSRECEFGLVKCGACGEQVKRRDLAGHYTNCAEMENNGKTERKPQVSMVEELSKNVALLELDLKKTKEALKLSQEEVRRVEKDLRDIRNQFNVRESGQGYVDPDWDPDYNHGYSPQSISQLSRLIARHLLHKPYYVDRNRTFTAIKRCYDFYHNYPGYTQDVHMLVATCFACNWFTEHQRKHFDRWLTTIVRPRCLR